MNAFEPTPSMIARLDALLAEPSAYRLGILGLGAAGRAMARHARDRGFALVLSDRRDDSIDAEFAPQFHSFEESVFDACDGLCVSPGVDPRQLAVERVHARKAPVFGELELVSKFAEPTIAITGTNGKSTTTAWIGHILEKADHEPFVGGNLGRPLLELSEFKGDSAVIELSSFQLETNYRRRFDVAVVLNVTPDHSERYDQFSDYVEAKSRILRYLKPDDVAILNADDPVTRSMASETQGRVLWLSTNTTSLPGEGASIVDSTVSVSEGIQCLSSFDFSDTELRGRHNRENALATVLAAHAVGLAPDQISKGYSSFSGLTHRHELVGIHRGVRFINDSKATNDEAAASAVEATNGDVILLCGGVDKGGGYAKLVKAASERVRLAICCGRAREILAEALVPVVPVECFDSFREGFDRAVEVSIENDVVLLAPACSSFDEFQDYRHRGDSFRQWMAMLDGDHEG